MSDEQALQLREICEENHRRFVERVAASGVVWGLRSAEGWVTCAASGAEDGEVMPFWSDRAYAARAAREEWAGYEPTSIALDSFIDPWLQGMHEDGTLVGTNWDANNCGLEVPADQLAQELVDCAEAR